MGILGSISGGLLGGGGGVANKASASATTTTTTTKNTDRRLVVGERGGGVSADHSTVNMTVDTSDPETVRRALDFAAQNDATMGAGYDALIKASERMVAMTGDRVASAYGNALTESKGSLEQKTIMVLGLAAAAVGVAWALRKRA